MQNAMNVWARGSFQYKGFRMVKGTVGTNTTKECSTLVTGCTAHTPLFISNVMIVGWLTLRDASQQKDWMTRISC